MEKHQELFVEGASKNGVKPKVAEELFNQMVLFAEYCLSYDTQILTIEYGSIAIGEIVEKRLNCTIYSVTRAGFLYTQPVIQWHDRGQQELFEYTLEDGSTIRATQDHKFMTTDGQMLPIDTIYAQGLELQQVKVPVLT